MPRSSNRKRKSEKSYVKLMSKIKKLTDLVEEKFRDDTDTDSTVHEEAPSFGSTSSSRCSTPTGPPLNQKITDDSPERPGSPPPHKITTTAQIHNILGEFKNQPILGQSLHCEIQQRWEVFLKEGVEQEEIKNFQSLYPQPVNLDTLYGPILNPEIITAIPQAVLKSDTYIQKIQDEIGIALCALSGPINNVLRDENDSSPNKTKILADTAKILCNVHNKLSVHRRYAIIPSLDLSIKETVIKAPIGNLLFGEDLGTRCKNAKELKKSGIEIKKKASFKSGSLNFKRLPVHKNVHWKAKYRIKSLQSPKIQFKRRQTMKTRGEKRERVTKYRQQRLR